MNPLNLFQESCERLLTENETQWINEAIEEFPFFSLLHLINAKNAIVTNQPSTESLKTKAAIYSPERRLASDYLREDFKLHYTLKIDDKPLENENGNIDHPKLETEINDHKLNVNASRENRPIQLHGTIDSNQIISEDIGLEPEKKVPTIWEISEDNSEIPKPKQPLNVTKSTGKSLEISPTEKVDSKNQDIEKEIKSRIERAKNLLRSTENHFIPIDNEVGNQSNISNQNLQNQIKTDDSNIISEDQSVNNNIQIIGVSSKDWSITNQFNYKIIGSTLTSGFLERFVKPSFDPKPPTLSAYRAFVDESEPNQLDNIIEPAGIFNTQEEAKIIIENPGDDTVILNSDTTQRKTEHHISQNRGINEQNQIIDKIIAEIHLEVSVNNETNQEFIIESTLLINETIQNEATSPSENTVENTNSDLVNISSEQVINEKIDHRDIQESKIKRRSGLTEKDISAFLNDFADGVDSGTDMPLTTESFKRFIAPTFDPKSATLSAYRMFDIDEEVNDVIPDEELQGYKTESFKRFVTPEFDIKSETLSTKRYYTKDVLGSEMEGEFEIEAFKPGSSRRGTQILHDKHEIKNSNLSEAARIERNVSFETSDEEKKKFVGKFSEHITSETFKKFKSDKVNEYEDHLAKFGGQDGTTSEMSNDDQSSMPHRIRTESMMRFITPDFGVGELDMAGQSTQQKDIISHTQQSEAELISYPENNPIETKGHGDAVNESFDASIGINVNPELTEKGNLISSKSSEETRIQSESMNRFIDPDFGGQTKSMTYASSVDLQNEYNEQATIESKQEDSNQEEKNKDLPERFRNDSMSRFIEPDFTAKSLHYEQETLTSNTDITSSAESNKIEIEQLPVEPDSSKILSIDTSKIPNIKSEETDSSINRTESMNRFIQPVFDEKSNTLHLERPNKGKKNKANESHDQIQENLINQNENIIFKEDESFVQNKVDKEDSSGTHDTITDGTLNNPYSQETKTQSEKGEDSTYLNISDDEGTKDKKIQETIIRYPGEEKDLEIKLRPDQLKYFNVNVGDVEGALNESVKIILDENQPEFDNDKDDQEGEFKSRRYSSPLISPEQIEAIEQDFFSTVDSQIGTVGNLNLDKVIIDYSKKTIEFIVEDTTLNKAVKTQESTNENTVDAQNDIFLRENSEIKSEEEIISKTKNVESVLPQIIDDESDVTPGFDLEIIESKPTDWSEPSIKFVVEPKEIKNIVTDYDQFLLEALALKEYFTEQEAKSFFKLIYENTTIENQNFIYDVFQLTPHQPLQLQTESNVLTDEDLAKNDETIKKSRELLTKTLNLTSEEEGISEKNIENQMNPELEKSNQNIDERILKFRKNLARIRNRTITDPGAINIGIFKERFIDSLVGVMNESVHTSNMEPGIESILGEPTNDPSPIDVVIDRFKSFEPTIYSSINKSDEISGSAFVDFQADDTESDFLDYVPQTETMAKILAKQGDKKTAILIYKNLSKKFPEKSKYYLGEINKIQ